MKLIELNQKSIKDYFNTAQNFFFSMMDFFCKCDQIERFIDYPVEIHTA